MTMTATAYSSYHNWLPSAVIILLMGLLTSWTGDRDMLLLSSLLSVGSEFVMKNGILLFYTVSSRAGNHDNLWSFVRALTTWIDF